jgi:SWIM/SEC-C metal-binding protein
VARLGSHKRPAFARVRSEQRAHELLDLCHQHGWQVVIELAGEDGTEDISDIERLLSPPAPTTKAPTQSVGRNDPCPCGSGQKFKKCCSGPATTAP